VDFSRSDDVEEDIESIDPREWDRIMQKKREAESKGSKPARVYASVSVVTASAAPTWMEEDDEPMAWGNDRIPLKRS